MGTTLTAALVIWPTAWVVHAGDSRCYRLRGPRLERLTLDHTMVQRMSDDGLLTPEAARRSRWRHALWKHLGKRSGPVDPEVISADLRWGDALLLDDRRHHGSAAGRGDVGDRVGARRGAERLPEDRLGRRREGRPGRHDPDLRPLREEETA
jgi:hypothetical protein